MLYYMVLLVNQKQIYVVPVFDLVLFNRVQNILFFTFLSLKNEFLALDIHLTENVNLWSRLGQEFFH